jgi:aminoglycoside phosphotransferase (APT) family kinase protein
VEAGVIERRALAAARAVATDGGLRCEQAEVVYSGSNVLVRLSPAPVVARVMSGTVVLHDDPQRWLEREVSVLRFLVPSGMAVAPSALIAPGPYRRDGLWMTCVEWVADADHPELHDAAETLGHALRDLHEELSTFGGELGGFVDVRDDVERLSRQLRPTTGLSAERIDSLQERLLALDDAVFGTALPAQPLHGDASLSNLLRTPERLVWNDFEDTFRGPVHWDVAGFVMSLQSRGADAAFVARALDAYGWADVPELAPFAEAHDLYGEIWQLYDGQRRTETS